MNKFKIGDRVKIKLSSSIIARVCSGDKEQQEEFKEALKIGLLGEVLRYESGYVLISKINYLNLHVNIYSPWGRFILAKENELELIEVVTPDDLEREKSLASIYSKIKNGKFPTILRDAFLNKKIPFKKRPSTPELISEVYSELGKSKVEILLNSGKISISPFYMGDWNWRIIYSEYDGSGYFGKPLSTYIGIIKSKMNSDYNGVYRKWQDSVFLNLAEQLVGTKTQPTGEKSKRMLVATAIENAHKLDFSIDSIEFYDSKIKEIIKSIGSQINLKLESSTVEQRLSLLEKRIGIRELFDSPFQQYKNWCNRNLRVPFESDLERFKSFLKDSNISEESALELMKKEFKPDHYSLVSRIIKKYC